MSFQPGQQAYCQAVGTSTTSNLVIFERDPTVNDVNYAIGKFWLNTTLQNLYYLNSLSNSTGQLLALWNLISVDSILASLSGSDTPSVPVFASSIANPLLDNIQLTNIDGSMTIVSDPGNNRVIFTAIAPAGTFTYLGIAGTSQLASVSHGYINQNASLTTITLPNTAPLGSVIAVQGLGVGGWVIQTGTGQNIQNGTVSTSTNGTLASVNRYDTCYLVCIVADTTWSTAYNTSYGLIAT